MDKQSGLHSVKLPCKQNKFLLLVNQVYMNYTHFYILKAATHFIIDYFIFFDYLTN